MRTLFSCHLSSQSPRRRRTSAWRRSIAVTKTGRRAGAGGGGAAGVSASETGSRSNERRATQRSPSRLRSSRVGLVISPMAATNAYVANLSIGHAPFRFPAILCAGRTDCHKERAAPSSREGYGKMEKTACLWGRKISDEARSNRLRTDVAAWRRDGERRLSAGAALILLLTQFFGDQKIIEKE